MGILTKRVRKQRNSTRKNKSKGGGCGVSGGKGKNKSKGGCGCSIGGKRKNKKSKTNKRKVKGGSQHLETLPLRYYYPLNDHSSSLSDSYGISSTTDKFAGGKKTRKQMKGGGMNGCRAPTESRFRACKLIFHHDGLRAASYRPGEARERAGEACRAFWSPEVLDRLESRCGQYHGPSMVPFYHAYLQNGPSRPMKSYQIMGGRLNT
jgi:hypothetical protein